MSMTRTFAALALAGLVAATGSARAGHHEDDETAIKAAVMDYFDGQGEGNRERLFRAFAEDEVSMVGVFPHEDGGTEVRAWKDMKAVLTSWANGENPPGAGRAHEFLDIHVTDGRIASVHFRYTDRFYDVLTLAKVDGEWTIIAKTFTTQ